MSNYSILKEQVLGILKKMFPDIVVHISSVDYCGPISVVFVSSPNQIRLSEIWDEISNALAIYFQTKLNTEFERWNLYVFYLSKDEVEKGLKYRIENDPVSSRKIVIDHFKDSINDKTMAAIISQHITNTNLNIKKQLPAPAPFTKNALIGPLIDGTLAISVKKGKSNGKSKEDISELLQNLETLLSK